jgi:hypothetical protein
MSEVQKMKLGLHAPLPSFPKIGEKMTFPPGDGSNTSQESQVLNPMGPSDGMAFAPSPDATDTASDTNHTVGLTVPGPGTGQMSFREPNSPEENSHK